MLKLNSVSFRYGKTDLFRDLNLDLKPGNIYGLLGKNGAGKTTLLKMMGGLLYPNSGTCFYNESDISKRQPSFLEDVFFLPEEFILPPIKGELFLKLRAPFYPNFDYTLFENYLEEFELPIDAVLNTLSFGQKKKFLLSFGLATRTQLMIMDEPTNGLDIPSKTILRRIIAKSMNEKRTILISTHRVKDVENLIDPILIVDDGHIIFNQSTLNVASNLVMEQVHALTGAEIYSQEILGGYQVVNKNISKQEGAVDLELLFNAVISEAVTVSKAFNMEGDDE